MPEAASPSATDAVGVSVQATLCSELSAGSSGCQRCRQCCPDEAITIGPSVEVSERCSACGICHAACVNGVFDPRERDDDELVAEGIEAARRRLLGGKHGKAAGDTRLTLACSASTADSRAVVVACLARLTEAVLIGLATRGVDRVALVRGDCGACRYRQSMRLFDEMRRATDAVARQLAVPLCLEESVAPTQGQPMRATARIPARASRRRAITLLGRRLLDGVIRRARALPESPPGPVNRRRARLVREVRRVLHGRVGDDRAAKPAELEATRSVFVTANVDASRCDGCGACAGLCPLDALHRESQAGRFRLRHAPSRCTACGVCTRVCDRDALTLEPATDWTDAAQEGWRLAVDLGEAACPRCGLAHVGPAGFLCPGCRQRAVFASR